MLGGNYCSDPRKVNTFMHAVSQSVIQGGILGINFDLTFDGFPEPRAAVRLHAAPANLLNDFTLQQSRKTYDRKLGWN